MGLVRLLVALVALAPLAVAHAGAVQRSSAAGCNPNLPPEFGGCGARSPYMDRLQGGVSGFGPRSGSAKPGFSGWIEVLNTGPTMPHLVVEVRTSGSFSARNIYAGFNTGRQKYRRPVRWLGLERSPFLWDFGRFPAGAVVVVHFRMHLTNGCSYRMDLQTYGDVLPSGRVNPATSVWGSGFGASGGGGSCSIPPPGRS